MEPGALKCVFPSTGMATVAWSDGFKPTKMSQTLIDVSDEDLAKKRHADVQAKKGAKDDGSESDLSSDDEEDDDDESGLRRSARKKPKKA